MDGKIPQKGGLTHAEESEIAIRWFNEAPQYQGWVMIPNRSGQAVFDMIQVPYGVPPGGGGSDYILFGQRDGLFTAEFMEIKTIAYPRLSKKQKRWYKRMAGLGARCWIFRETINDPGFEVIRWPAAVVKASNE